MARTSVRRCQIESGSNARQGKSGPARTRRREPDVTRDNADAPIGGLRTPARRAPRHHHAGRHPQTFTTAEIVVSSPSRFRVHGSQQTSRVPEPLFRKLLSTTRQIWNGGVLETLTAFIHQWRRIHMPRKFLIAACTILLASSAFAQSPTSKNAPGQQMQKAQETGKPSTGPGASEYTPGHKMQDARKTGQKSTGPGASEYAPGHQTTTGSSTTTRKK